VSAFRDHLDRQEPVAWVTALSLQPSPQPGPAEAGGATALVTREAVALGTTDPRAAVLARRMLAGREAGAVQALEGGIEVFIEPFLPPPLLLLVGGVHVAIPLVRFAKELGFRVVVIDPRQKFANPDRFPQADEIWVEWPDEALAHLKVDDATYIVLLTHDPKIDEPTLAAALKTGARYIGAIGSRKTHAGRFERMSRWGVTAEELRRVYAPIGLDLGGRTPAETALSIMAEVVAVKNGRPGGPLRGASNPIAAERAPSP
jgi:xanthine dehydrogenase accessory factor